MLAYLVSRHKPLDGCFTENLIGVWNYPLFLRRFYTGWQIHDGHRRRHSSRDSLNLQFPIVDQSHDHTSSRITMISKDQLPLFKRLPWLTDAVITPFEKTEEYGAKVSLPVHCLYGC
jgi:hypothetical protein